MYSRSGPSPSSPSQARAESMSEPGDSSLRPWLPSASHANGHGGSPISSTRISTSLRVQASATIERIALIWFGARRASCMDTSAFGSRDAASRTCSRSLASSIERVSANGVSVWAVSRSTSLRTPIGSPDGDTTGTWRTPRLSISSITSPPRRSGVTVKAGALITSRTGPSADRPSATTARRSRSVRIPKRPSPRRTIVASSPDSVSSRADSRTVASGSQMSGSPRTRRSAGLLCGVDVGRQRSWVRL